MHHPMITHIEADSTQSVSQSLCLRPSESAIFPPCPLLLPSSLFRSLSSALPLSGQKILLPFCFLSLFTQHSSPRTSVVVDFFIGGQRHQHHRHRQHQQQKYHLAAVQQTVRVYIFTDTSLILSFFPLMNWNSMT